MGWRLNLLTEKHKAKLVASGWHAYHSGLSETETLATEVASIALTLGEIVPGRDGHPVEQIVPQEVASAYPGSLSSRFGLETLPLHTDTAHWPIPCRYLVMACAEPGPNPTPTILLDSRAVQITASEAKFCMSAVFLIRNGQRSFYGSIMERNRPFIRFDPGCMKAVTDDRVTEVDLFSLRRNERVIYRHEWTRGDILVIDNWRVLHGRGVDSPTERGRKLLRAMVR
ncbi:hypothetical protein EJV46_11875 [Roseococcus sp. SYP-B2431]|uniref:TauD/TfdA family dioxygenase n=1 Tax=Roseococcus sp. SYP-B2431 TaxID=2496640 RepID=UPI00103CED77|nr:hypothetical protein EJV46_11875 [Roseococcus sp. SYP-B2431]